ncbi:hypothetical protein CLOM_g9327 [Closterium sp. NIES-68]|nr:hypothetical protein CLOM_g9327 [Closterium sp. NIES-68]GJP83857.1 hypothetical protein CLOP_g13958 [Closterium sp. NIES-67]
MVVPSSLQSPKFLESCPQFLPSGSPCSRLEELLISKCNQFHRLPDGLGELLPFLRKVALYGCESLVELPPSVTSLTRLETLAVANCSRLSSLPRNLGRLPALKVLVLQYLPLSALPNSFCHLTSLQTLTLMSCNKLSWLPAGFGRLTALKSFFV